MKILFTKIYAVLVSILVKINELVSSPSSVELGSLKVKGTALFVLPIVVFYCWFQLERIMILLSSDLPAEIILKLASLFQ
jgi:hypothetical protein